MPEVRVEETERGPALDNGDLRIEVHLNKGTFDVIDLRAGRTVLRDAAVAVSLRDAPTFQTRGEGLEFAGPADVDDVHGRGVSLTLVRETDEDEPELSFTVTLYEDSRNAIVQADVHNTSLAPIRVQAFHVLDAATLDLGAPGNALRFYKHGWQSWSPSLVLDCSGEDVPMSPPVIAPGTQPTPADGRFVSDLMTAIVDPASGYGLVAGFVSAADQFSHVWFDRDAGSLSAVSHADGIELGPRATLASERLYIEPSDAPLEAMCRYGDALGREMEALPYDAVTSGWCSWYYYFQGISEAEVLANLDYLAANPGALPVEYVQIDDGYQAEIGDWLTANEKFPRGMKQLASDIHARGYKAGLWLAPFIAGAKSRLFAEHPDWLVSRTGGPAIALINWQQTCYALDLTHPAVIAWLDELFRTICDDWGYDYVKIDFIFAGAVDGVRHDPNLTRAQAYRRGLETIRDAVGNRFVLACGNPMGPSVGLVDGARIGPDVAPYWYPMARGAARSTLSDPSAVNSIRNTITRFWMHGRLWMNDPDCLLVRETDTALAGDEGARAGDGDRPQRRHGAEQRQPSEAEPRAPGADLAAAAGLRPFSRPAGPLPDARPAALLRAGLRDAPAARRLQLGGRRRGDRDAAAAGTLARLRALGARVHRPPRGLAPAAGAATRLPSPAPDAGPRPPAGHRLHVPHHAGRGGDRRRGVGRLDAAGALAPGR